MRKSERSYVSCSEREKEAETERKRKKNPQLPEIVFYVTWLAADLITSDWT